MGDTGGKMRNEFTAVVERAGRWHVAYCPEIPGANGQGRTKTAALRSLANAIALILEDRRKDGLLVYWIIHFYFRKASPNRSSGDYDRCWSLVGEAFFRGLPVRVHGD